MDNSKIDIDPNLITKEMMWELIQLMPANDANAFRAQLIKLGKTMGLHMPSYDMSDAEILEFQEKITNRMLDMFNDFMKTK